MISLYIITHNEAANIERCIKSTYGLVDEIIIIDSGSTDATCEIARNCEAKVLLHPWEGYVAQRNFALSQCSHKWVLTLDADEEFCRSWLKDRKRVNVPAPLDLTGNSRQISVFREWGEKLIFSFGDVSHPGVTSTDQHPPLHKRSFMELNKIC